MATATAEPRTLVETSTPGWYLDPNTGKNTRKAQVDKVISQAQFEKAMKGNGSSAGAQIFVSDTGKALVGPTTTIVCIDCGASRVVKIQDAFQVKRCAEDQKAHRNKLKREKRAAARKG